jgi:dephospho-CoA kinase
MIVIGLTGGIGMGKSTVAAMFQSHGIWTFNADTAVHRLQARGGRAIPVLENSFPGTVEHGILNRALLREKVLADPVAMRRLEFLMHPLVHQEEQKFRALARRARRRAILLDIPLLFETGGERRVDVTVTVTCPRAAQIARVKKRGIPPAQIAAIIAKQMPDSQKRAKADHVIPTGLSKFATFQAVNRLVRTLLPLSAT